VVEEVVKFAQEHTATHILTMNSPSPRHRQLCKTISQGLSKGSKVEVLYDRPFVNYTGRMDMKRYSRYWNTIKWMALKGK
jgi:hypothetical protein